MKRLVLRAEMSNDQIRKLMFWLTHEIIDSPVRVDELKINDTLFISVDQAEVDNKNEGWSRIIEETGYREL